jgi:hypothetical protein
MTQMSGDAEYDAWLAEQARYEDADERLEDLPHSQRGIPIDHDRPPLFLTAQERRKVAAGLELTMVMQRTLGDAAGALESVLLRAKVLNGMGDDG